MLFSVQITLNQRIKQLTLLTRGLEVVVVVVEVVEDEGLGRTISNGFNLKTNDKTM